VVAEDHDLLAAIELGGPRRDVAHRKEDGALDSRGRVLGGLPDVEEPDAGTAPAGRRLGGTDRRGVQNPSRTLVTRDCANRSASASIATFSRSE